MDDAMLINGVSACNAFCVADDIPSDAEAEARSHSVDAEPLPVHTGKPESFEHVPKKGKL